MKKYNYFVNNVQVPRKDFFAQLRNACYRVVDTDVIGGWCGIDFMEFDEKRYKRCLRDLNNNIEIFIIGSNSKSFKRKEAKYEMACI